METIVCIQCTKKISCMRIFSFMWHTTWSRFHITRQLRNSRTNSHKTRYTLSFLPTVKALQHPLTLRAFSIISLDTKKERLKSYSNKKIANPTTTRYTNSTRVNPDDNFRYPPPNFKIQKCNDCWKALVSPLWECRNK